MGLVARTDHEDDEFAAYKMQIGNDVSDISLCRVSRKLELHREVLCFSFTTYKQWAPTRKYATFHYPRSMELSDNKCVIAVRCCERQYGMTDSRECARYVINNKTSSNSIFILMTTIL